MTAAIRQLAQADVQFVEELLSLFADAFGDPEQYNRLRPSRGYLEQLLADESIIALACMSGDEVVGGLVAYDLKKFEQERSEIYIYDLAVATAHRRQGIATALIEQLKNIAAQRGAWVIFVQADTGAEDAPAIALYSRMGKREEVLHFDIAIDAARPVRNGTV